MKHKTTWSVFILIVFSYVGCSWDYFVSDYIFKQHCKEDVGVFIYERVELDDAYFNPFLPGTPEKSLDLRFVFGENRLLDKGTFDREYDLEMFKKILVSDIGPVYLIQTSITRLSDNKLLSKSVSVRNEKGWLAKLTSFGYAYDQCPTRHRKSGSDMNEHMRNHFALVKSTFYVE